VISALAVNVLLLIPCRFAVENQAQYAVFRDAFASDLHRRVMPEKRAFNE